MTDAYRVVSSPITTSDLEDDVVCKRHPLVRAMKSAFLFLQSLLPGSIYQPLFGVCFATYKQVLRQLYFRNVAFGWLAGDQRRARRAKAIYDVMPYSLVGARGLEATFDAASDLNMNDVSGAFVECGVARGGCAALMAGVAACNSTPRTVWLFDSFEGLPSPSAQDYDRQSTGKHIRPLDRGSCLGTREQVEWLLFSKLGLDRASIFLVKGWFQETLSAHKDRVGPISLLRIDGDWYDSTMCCLDSFYDNVVGGGSIIIDDYGVCFGCKKAVHEFFEKKNIQPHLIPDTRGGVRFTKSS